MKTIRIFIASSSELENDRKEFREFLGVENDRLHKKGVYLELVEWRYFLDAISTTRLQDEYNEELKKCDIAVCLFYSKAGKYTLEEFNVAYQNFLETGKPLIYTYFRTGAPELDPLIEQQKALIDFKKRLLEIEHFYTSYESIGDLKYRFKKQLEYLGDKGLILLQDEIRFITGSKPFNEYLTKSLIETFQENCGPAAKLYERVNGIPNWERQTRISDKAKEIISYSLVGSLGVQFSKLMAIGKEDSSEGKYKKYLRNCIELCRLSIDLLCNILLSKLWDYKKNQPVHISDRNKKLLYHRFDTFVGLTIVENYTLFLALFETYKSNELRFPIDELPDYSNENLVALGTICEKLHSLSDLLESNIISRKICFESEVLTADFFKKFDFLTQYKMASIRAVDYSEVRYNNPHYLHKYTALGIDSKANINAEKLSYTTESIQTDSVLMYKGDNYQDSVNLFPFVIDYNAITFELGAKICFFQCEDVTNESLEYLFLDDNSTIKLQFENVSEKFEKNELMGDKEKRKKLNIDNVLDGLREAKSCLLDEVNLDDI